MRALIVYASWTGTTLKIAKLLADALRQLEIETAVKQCTEAYPSEFLDVDICVVATYTYGADGDLPEEAEDFYYEMEEVDLNGKIFGVLGSGDRKYEKFCPAVDYFDKQFETSKAVRGAQPLKINLQPNEQDVLAINDFAAELKKSLLSKISSINQEG